MCLSSVRGRRKCRGWRCWKLASLRLILTQQFFAILEANYPETMKNLIVVRGEPRMGMTSWGGNGEEWGRGTAGKPPRPRTVKQSWVENGSLFVQLSPPLILLEYANHTLVCCSNVKYAMSLNVYCYFLYRPGWGLASESPWTENPWSGNSPCLQRLYDKGLTACVLGSDDLASHQVCGANQGHLIEPQFSHSVKWGYMAPSL